jgi:ubiquinone/menaquinone biosynthesis C-methylase UbiE
MNRLHHWICSSRLWKWNVQEKLLPWALRDTPLGGRILEIGPGPGLTTDTLRRRFDHVTAVELDEALARAAQARLAGTNASVIEGDATELPFPDKSFSGVVSFTMLHHIPSAELQDRMLREVHRVLEPQGTFLATDNLSNFVMKLVHIGDTMVLVDPRTLGGRLEAAGFCDVSVETGSYMFRVVAHRVDGHRADATSEDARRADPTPSENGRERASIGEAAPLVR